MLPSSHVITIYVPRVSTCACIYDLFCLQYNKYLDTKVISKLVNVKGL